MSIEESVPDQPGNIAETLTQFAARFAGNYTAFKKCRRGLWESVGSVVELAARLDGDPDAQALLLQQVRQRGDVKASKNFEANVYSTEELLLILGMGYHEDDKSSRSQYSSAIEAFKSDPDRERTEATFVDWIAFMGGLRKAAASLADGQEEQDAGSAVANGDASNGANAETSGDGGSSRRSADHGLDLVENVALLQKNRPDLPEFKADLPDEFFVDGAALLLVIKGKERVDGRMTGAEKNVLAKAFVDEAILARLTAEAYRGGSKAEIREEELLHAINEYALAAAGAPAFGHDIKFNNVMRFQRAVNKLVADPKLTEKYQLSGARVATRTLPNGPDKTASIDVANTGYHDYDPARFIVGAQPNVLVPYGLFADLDASHAAAKEYDAGFRARKLARKRPAKPRKK